MAPLLTKLGRTGLTSSRLWFKSEQYRICQKFHQECSTCVFIYSGCQTLQSHKLVFIGFYSDETSAIVPQVL